MATAAYSQAPVDTIGIAQFHPTKPGTQIWTSAHWANEHARTIKYDVDPYDPTHWTEDHSGGTDGFRVDGAGTMMMSGSGPRFHINSTQATKVAAQLFLNTEFTAYFQHRGSAGAAWGGLVVGARTGAPAAIDSRRTFACACLERWQRLRRHHLLRAFSQRRQMGF